MELHYSTTFGYRSEYSGATTKPGSCFLTGPYRPTPQGEELWYFQCKRYRSINARTLKDEVDKYLRLAQERPHLRPAGVVFVVSCAMSARVREEVGAYCEQHGLAYEFWALTELGMRAKRHPDLLREFFNLTP